MNCPVCQGKCCRDLDSGYHVEHRDAEVYLHACECADGTWVDPDAQALDEVTAEARRLSTAVDRLERESLEVLAALGLHEDTEHDKVLEHIRVLMQEHNEMRMVIEGHRYRFNTENLNPTIDIEALRSRIAEYDPDAPRCQKKVEEHRNYAPDYLKPDDPEWEIYSTTTYSPCCRPDGHEGECRNSRRVLGWPGYATLVALLDEVKNLRSKVDKPRAHLDDLLARVEQGARDVEQAKIVAWLRYLASHGTRITPQKEKLLSDVCDALERGAHLKGERAHLDELLARVEQGARAVEQAKIVAWLRRNPGKSRAPECITAMTPFEAADAIERGEHRKGGNHD